MAARFYTVSTHSIRSERAALAPRWGIKPSRTWFVARPASLGRVEGPTYGLGIATRVAPRGGFMTTHRAQCTCGQLSVTCEGDPVSTWVCHCFDCKRATGSAFSFGARFPDTSVCIEGQATEWVRIGSQGGRITSSFCPLCGAAVYATNSGMLGFIRVRGGCFAEVDFPPPPTISAFHDARKYPWLELRCEPLDRRG